MDGHLCERVLLARTREPPPCLYKRRGEEMPIAAEEIPDPKED